MRSSPLAAAVLVAAVYAQAPPLQPDVRERIAAALGVADPFAELARLAADSPLEREAARKALDAHAAAAPADAARLAHAGLWSDDPSVALGACSRLTHPQLDLADSARYVDVGLPDLWAASPVTDFGDYRYVLDSVSVERLFAELPPRNRDVYNILQQIHRNLRAAHVPMLCRLMSCDQSMLRHEALDTLKVLTWYTDRYRDEIGRALLRWNDSVLVAPNEERPDTYQSRELDLPDGEGGFPPVLHAVIERLYLEPVVNEDMRSMRAWARRWANDESAGAPDRELLAQLLDSESPDARWIALRAMRDLVDPDTAALLLGVAEEDEDPLSIAYALAALARRGHSDAARRLRDRAEADPAALALWLEGGGDDAIAETTAIVCGDDPERGIAWIERLELAVEHRPVYGIALPRALGPMLEQRAHASTRDAARLVELVRTVPECRTERLIRRTIDALTSDSLPSFAEVAPYCEVVDSDALLAKLRTLTEHDEAVELLARVGDPPSAADIVAWFDDAEPRDWFVLARTDADEVRARLSRAAREVEFPDGDPADWADPLLALAALDGLPEATARGWARACSYRTQALRESFGSWREPILRNEPIAALRTFLASAPPSIGAFDGLGLVADDAVTAFLRDRCMRRELGECSAAIGELAVAGDAVAVAEMRAVLAAGHHGWIDDATTRALTLGFDPATLPHWIDELESNCCRGVAAASVLEDFVGVDAFTIPDGGMVTRRTWARELLDRVGDDLRFSRIAGRHVGVARTR